LKSGPRRLFAVAVPLVGLTTACVYYNALYDAGNAYDAGVEAMQEGQGNYARVQFDSVIAKTDRILRRHSGSKWADDAALLKTRSEINNKLWEAASQSADLAMRLSRNSTDSASSLGLGGIAALQLGSPQQSDSMLSRALSGEINSDDRANFLFHRGLARQELGLPSEAATDLQTASEQIDLTRDARLELARALRQIEQYDRSAEVTADILTSNEFGRLSLAERAQVDSLSEAAPAVFEAVLSELLSTPDLQPSMRTMLELLRGQAFENLDELEAAVAALDDAARAGTNNRWAQEASLRASVIRIQNAREPGDIQATIPALNLAQGSPRSGIRDTARQMARSAQLFDEFTKAWEGRGSSAAEAALRAAEVAGAELQSHAVARGLYLKYLELAPESPWAAKAIYGALAYSGHRPGDWVRDEGAETDSDLVARLGEIPVDNPYRLALLENVQDDWYDSTYVLAEIDLEARISEIQMLFDTTVVRVRRDSVPMIAAPGETDPDERVDSDAQP